MVVVHDYIKYNKLRELKGVNVYLREVFCLICEIQFSSIRKKGDSTKYGTNVAWKINIWTNDFSISSARASQIKKDILKWGVTIMKP